jgi:hypothetical protein
MNYDKLLYIKERYGHQSSWAVWNEKVKDLSIFDNLNDIRTTNKFVLVGLNISKKIDSPFGNFHSGKNDYKLRYALENTILWGSYMTDIIKDYEQKISGKVMKYLKDNPDFLQDNIDSFKNELDDISRSFDSVDCDSDCRKPLLIALGNDVYKLLTSNLKDKYVIRKVTHYSAFINQYDLKSEFNKIISELNP